jgi:hypothetical protein
MQMHKPEQGLYGSFSTYGPSEHVSDCNPLVTQFSKDSCRHENERVIEEPYHGSFKIRNLTTQQATEVELDPEGKYKVRLDPGQYEVCVLEECSDPLEIPMGKYATYGQRLPRAVAGVGAGAGTDTAKTGAAVGKAPAGRSK